MEIFLKLVMMDSSTNESYTIDAAYFHVSLFLVCYFLLNNHIICPTPHTHNVICGMLPLLGSYIKYFQTGPSVKIPWLCGWCDLGPDMAQNLLTQTCLYWTQTKVEYQILIEQNKIQKLIVSTYLY